MLIWQQMIICAVAIVEVLEIELHAVAHIVHAIHIQELLKVIVLACLHAMVLAVPSRVHHGHG